MGKFLKEDGHWSLGVPQFIGTLWAIWNTRNDQVFRHTRATLQMLRVHEEEGYSQHTEFSAADHPGLQPPPAPNLDLPPGFHIANLGRDKNGTSKLTIQIDGSWDAKSGRGGAAWVVCNHQQIMHRQGVLTYAHSALQTETIACLNAVRWARTASVTNLVINTDSQLLFKLLASPRPDDITLRYTLNAIKEEASTFTWCCIRKVSRAHVQRFDDCDNVKILRI